MCIAELAVHDSVSSIFNFSLAFCGLIFRTESNDLMS